MVDLVEQDLYPLLLALLYLDDAIELGFGVAAAGFHITFQHHVIRCIDVLIQRGAELLNAERCEVSVVDALLE